LKNGSELKKEREEKKMKTTKTLRTSTHREDPITMSGRNWRLFLVAVRVPPLLYVRILN
jgi:hypothetical protein